MAHITHEFAKRLRREIKLRIREMRDGCIDCRKAKGLCHEHYDAAMDLVLEPRKHLNLKSK